MHQGCSSHVLAACHQCLSHTTAQTVHGLIIATWLSVMSHAWQGTLSPAAQTRGVVYARVVLQVSMAG